MPQISTKLEESDLVGIKLCDCGSESLAINYCFDPKEDCKKGQIYFCDLCKIEHLQHATIYITDFKKKHFRTIE